MGELNSRKFTVHIIPIHNRYITTKRHTPNLLAKYHRKQSTIVNVQEGWLATHRLWQHRHTHRYEMKYCTVTLSWILYKRVRPPHLEQHTARRQRQTKSEDVLLFHCRSSLHLAERLFHYWHIIEDSRVKYS